VVLFVYVDNSNVWIEGQRASAVAKGMAKDAWEAQEKGILDSSWRYDFGRLYELACRAASPSKPAYWTPSRSRAPKLEPRETARSAAFVGRVAVGPFDRLPP
jgi:hypothetical protein